MTFKDRPWKRRELIRMENQTRNSIAHAEKTLFEARDSHKIRINTDMDWGFLLGTELRHNIVLSFTPSLPENMAEELGKVLKAKAEEYLDGLEKTV